MSETVPAARRTVPAWARRLGVLAADVSVAALVFVTSLGAHVEDTEGGHLVPQIAAASTALALCVRRLWPRVSGVLVGLGGLVVLAVSFADPAGLRNSGHGGAVGTCAVSALFSLYSLAAHAPRTWAYAALAIAETAALVVTGMLVVGPTPAHRLAALPGVAALVAGMWALGWVRRTRRETLALLTERNRALEAERETAADKAAADERTRIAREMHDIVAHSLSSVIAQADGGRYAARADPEAGVRTLETIGATSRQALADMRALLGVLRDETDRDTAAPPGLDEIDSLVTHERALGATVTSTTTGVPRSVAPALGLSAYRIVQESLTNSRLHSPPGSVVDVRLDWTPDRLEIVVEDSAPGVAGRPVANAVPPGGRGLLGMRERAALHGGTVEAGPTATGYRVRARLPLG